MSYDDQYDAPLSGAERVRVRAVELSLAHFYTDGTPEEKAEEFVTAARVFERYIIGQRATATKEQLSEAYEIADRLLSRGVMAGGTEPETVTVEIGPLRELVRMLSGLSDGAPF